MTPPPSRLLVLDSGPNSPDINMARDEALLVTATSRGMPVLRLYGWTEPAATFGYFQRIADVEARTSLRPLVRRPTGGGIVPHDRDWTYCLVFPPEHPWYHLRAVESYRTVHEWIARSFAGIGFVTELAPCCRREIPGACFEGHEQFDLLWKGRKIAGAAQRRNRLGLLIQGSIQPPHGASRRLDWQTALVASRPTDFLGEPRPFDCDARYEAVAIDLSETKYRTDAYNRLR